MVESLHCWYTCLILVSLGQSPSTLDSSLLGFSNVITTFTTFVSFSSCRYSPLEALNLTPDIERNVQKFSLPTSIILSFPPSSLPPYGRPILCYKIVILIVGTKIHQLKGSTCYKSLNGRQQRSPYVHSCA